MQTGKFLAFLLMIPISGIYSADFYSNSFEDNLNVWKIGSGKELFSISDKEAVDGKKSLHILDKGDNEGCGMETDFIPAGKGVYKLSAKVRIYDGYGPFMGVNFYDSSKKFISQGNLHFGSKPENSDWKEYSLEIPAYSEDTAFLKVKVGSPVRNSNDLYIDELKLSFEEAKAVPPLWTPLYKIKPEEKARLTAADVVGPDGIVYPDFSRAGVRGGIPDISSLKIVRVEDFGAVPNDGKDDSDAIRKAVSSLGSDGIVQIGEGTYNLRGFIKITGNGIIIKGAGKENTKLVFDYAPEGGIEFYGMKEGQAVGPETPVHVYALPNPPGTVPPEPLLTTKKMVGALKTIKLSANGMEFANWERSMHSGNRSHLISNFTKIASQLKKGELIVTADIVYEDSSRFSKSIKLKYDPASLEKGVPERPGSVITFAGEGFVDEEIRLAADAKRGATEIVLVKKDHGIKAGDMIRIMANETPARRALVRNACNWGVYRAYMVFVKSVDGVRLTLDQPLRIEYPVADESFVRKQNLISRCGVADLTYEAVSDFWTTAVTFSNAVDCWADNVDVIKAGRNTIYGEKAKFCTIRNSVYKDSWFKGGGGTGYSGWEHAYDCLMENVTTYKLRHFPLFQWSAAGNVIRNCTAYDSDAQWHSGWTNENLMENCVVYSTTRENGGYGFGMWASPPEDGAHGPNGPRNVVYNCDVVSLKDAVWLGGMNENWIFAYNRFRVQDGPGIFLKTFGFDHIIRGNVFVLEDKKSPMMIISSPDCTGLEVYDNTVYGGAGVLYKGLLAPIVDKNNKFLPFDKNAPRPVPAVPSIYEWQLKNVKKGN